VLGDLAATVLLQNKLGLARSYYRQQLERTLAVVEWDDPEAFPPKFFLQALIGDGELNIVQADEATTVEIVRYLPQDTGHPSSRSGFLQQSRRAQGKTTYLLDLENTDFLWRRYIVSK